MRAEMDEALLSAAHSGAYIMGPQVAELEQQLAEHRTEEARLYRVEEQQNTYNTPENRFLKHALLTVQKRYASLAARVLAQDSNLAETHRARIASIRDNPLSISFCRASS